MRKYIYITIVLWVSLASCDLLDIEPEEVLTDDLALQNITDYEKALLGAYATLRSGNYYGRDYLFLPEILADNLQVTSQNRGTYIFQHSWDYTANDDEGMWSAVYTLIQRANTVIVGIDGVAEQSSGQKNRLLGQALALRALGHFDLLRYYGQSYDRNSTLLGVPVVTELLEPDAQPARTTVQEVYTQIYNDLNTAKTLLGSIDQTIAQPHLINQLTVSAILARVSLYAGEWQLAIDNATEVIDARSLSTITEFEEMWADQGNVGETLWSVPFVNGEGAQFANLLYNPGQQEAQFVPSEALTGIYDAVNDIRYSRYFLTLNDDENLPFPVVQEKYPNAFNDARLFRIAEMYLTRAEAIVQNGGDLASALDDLNALRTQRITNYTDETSTAGLLNRILLERRRELAMEGHRWFDIRRDMDRSNIGVIRGSDCLSPATRCTLEAGNFRFILPIPQSEILANENMVQNSGY